MAAVNHIRNIRNQRKRDVFCDFVARCLEGGEHVNLDNLLEMFDNTNNNFDEREIEKLTTLAGEDK